MTTGNTFPAVIGVGAAFTNVKAGQNTANFTLEPGTWAIALEMYDETAALGNDKVSLVQVTAGGGNAANTTLFDMLRSGYYHLQVPRGPLITYYFSTVNGCKNVKINLVSNNIGPS